MAQWLRTPAIKFESAKRYKRVYASNLEFYKKGFVDVDFLKVEHDSELELSHEALITGSKGDNFKIKSLPTANYIFRNETNQWGRVRNVEDGHGMNVSFFYDKPFYRSSITWNNKLHKCDTINQHMIPLKTSSSKYKSDIQDIHVVIRKEDSRFKYNIRNAVRPPYFKFTTKRYTILSLRVPLISNSI
ncbi:hypothetical protein HELRODRAFT_163000 [Helobdella robusta]|uniref:Uncharacterized protein n=1 Tax=Helobdella robusta TaxID=6412 RepID=T1ETJ2_HELRO|nr:hypothetical protein HELRODRAFT_163000 [Helobdella robusta]ESN99451.1 hypothetical protein HELRODRAFT_163000 [Helobdella robusta]